MLSIMQGLVEDVMYVSQGDMPGLEGWLSRGEELCLVPGLNSRLAGQEEHRHNHSKTPLQGYKYQKLKVVSPWQV